MQQVYKAPQEGIIFDGIIKLALQNDKLRGIRKGDVIGRYVLPKNWYCVSEPTVVPKTSGTGTYILIVATWIVDKSPASTTVTMDAIEEGFSSMKSRLIVLDGDKVDKVVFALDLPYHVPCGLHSMFLDWDKMK